MWKATVCAVVILILTGCQGTPRYGGGFHKAEGDYIPRDDEAVYDDTTVESDVNYLVDPVAMGEIIDHYLGKPYAGRGNGEKGYDCSEFVDAVYYEYAAIHLPRTTGHLFKAGRNVRPGDLYFGDLVFFDTGGKGVSHVGIYIGYNEFVHASQSAGIVISNLEETYYKKRYLGARRVME